MISSRVGRLAAQLWIAAFVGFLGTYLLVTVDGMRVPVQLLYGVPLAAWAALRLREPRDSLDVTVLVAVSAHLVVAFLGVDRIGSLGASGLALGLAVLFWLMRDVGARPALREAASLAVAVPIVAWLAAAAVAWILEKAAWVAAGGGIPALESYQVFVWGTTNAFPILAMLSVPFVANLTPGPGRRLLGVALGLSAVVVVPFSVGRAGWLGIVAAVVMYEAIGGWRRARWISSWVRGARARAGLAAIGAAALVLLLALNASRVASAVAANFDTRGRIWDQAVGIVAADPLTGSGPGTFSWVRLAHVPDFSDPIGVILAHNAWLQTLADGGLVLGVAFGVAALSWVVAVWRARAGMTDAQRLAAAAVIGLSAASLLDDFSFLPAIVAMAVTLAAWTVPAPNPGAAPAGRPWLLVGALVIVAVALWPMIAVERARIAASDARASAVAGRWHDAADGFALAAGDHPTNPLIHLSQGLALAEVGDVVAARDAYERARALSPGDPRAAGALAALADADDERIRMLDEATRTSTDAQYAVRLADVLIGSDEAAAARAYALAVVLRTDLYPLIVHGRRSLDVLAALPEVMSRVDAADSNRARRVAWDIGLADAILPADAPAAWRAVAAADQGRFDEARSRVEEARADAPYDQFTHLAAAAVARFACDEDDYRRAMRLAGRVLGGPLPTLAIGRDPIYRDFGLGDYQPSWVDRPPPLPVWPFGLVRSPTCAWAP